MKKIKFAIFCLSLFVAFMMASCKNILSDDQKSVATSSASFKFPDDISAKLEAVRDAIGANSDSSYVVTVKLTGDYDYSDSTEKTFETADSIKDASFTFDKIKVGYVVKASVIITLGDIELFSGESDEVEIVEDSSKNNLKVSLKSKAAPFEIRFYYSDDPATYYTASDTLVPYKPTSSSESSTASTLNFAIYKDGQQYTGSDFTATWKLNETTVESSEEGNLTLSDNSLSFTANIRNLDTTKANTVSCSIAKELYKADLAPLSFTFTEDLDTYNRYLLMRTAMLSYTPYYYYNVFESAGTEETPLSDDENSGNALKSISLTSGTVGMDLANLNLYQLGSSSTDSGTTTTLTVIPYNISSHSYSDSDGSTSTIPLGSLDISKINFISAYNSNIALYPKGGYTAPTTYADSEFSLTSLPFYYCKAGGSPVAISVQNAVADYSDTYISGLSVQKDGIYVLAGSNITGTDNKVYPSVFSILKYPLDVTSSSVPKVLEVTSIIPAGTDADGNGISHATIKDAAIHDGYLYVIGGYYLPGFNDNNNGNLTRGFMFRVNLSDFTVDKTFGTSGLAGYEAYSSNATTLAMSSEDSNFYYPVRFVAVTPKKLVIVDDGGYASDGGTKKKRLVTYTFDSNTLSAEDITADSTYFLNSHDGCSFTDNY